MSKTDNMIAKFIAWETGCQRKAGELLPIYYRRAKDYNKAKTNGTFTIKGDAGGLTVVGVTIKTYLAFLKDSGKITAEAEARKMLVNMDYLEWHEILMKRFFNCWKADRIINTSIMEICVDFGWLCGTSTAIKRVQSALGLTADGMVGNFTLGKLNSTPASSVHAKIKAAYKKRIEDIIKANPLQAKFRNGWMNRINSYSFSA